MEHPALDDETANRLLRGSLPPEDAPAGFETVAVLLRAAAGPATDDEVADPRGVVPALTEGLRGPPAPATRRGRAACRRTRLGRLVASPALVAALVATGAAAAAAATGDLPRPVQSAVAGVASQAGVDLPEPPAHHGHGRHASVAPRSGDTADDGSGGTTVTTGTTVTLAPPLNGPALRALCGAYASGNGAVRGGKADATPFRALADAATAAGDTVGQYCAAATAAAGEGTSPTTTPTTTPTAPPTTASAPPWSNGAGTTPGAQHGPPATLGNGAPHPSTATTVAHGNPHATPPGQQHANTGSANAGGNGTSNARGGNRAGHP